MDVPTCTCWDIPRSDCCYCGAQEVIERIALSKRHFYWAFWS